MVTSHIPFVILTAKVNEETTYEGFSYGADDYITKPFSMKLLQIRIAKLIEKNLKLQEHFKLSMLSEPQNIAVESINEKFIYLLVKAIDENIDNFDLNIELLCQKMNITHQQIYRKLKALTGQTVNEFIRTVRLKRAAQLLTESDLNISEIMYSVGFSNRSYFSKCFAEEYEFTPKEYRAKNS
jgi:AraC-like DNA-binding protein